MPDMYQGSEYPSSQSTRSLVALQASHERGQDSVLIYGYKQLVALVECIILSASSQRPQQM